MTTWKIVCMVSELKSWAEKLTGKTKQNNLYIMLIYYVVYKYVIYVLWKLNRPNRRGENPKRVKSVLQNAIKGNSYFLSSLLDRTERENMKKIIKNILICMEFILFAFLGGEVEDTKLFILSKIIIIILMIVNAIVIDKLEK